MENNNNKLNIDNKKIDNISKTDNKTQKKEDPYKTCCMSAGFFDKKLITSCILTAVISVVGVFGVLKLGLDSNESRIQELIDNNKNIEEKLKGVGDVISDLDRSIKSIKSEFEEGRENSAYIYTSIASMQKDISAIKKEFHLDDSSLQKNNDNSIDNDKNNNIDDENLSKLSMEEINFIKSLETLVEGGTPFIDFLKSNENKIDITKYPSGKELYEISKNIVKTVDMLKNDMISLGKSEFNVQTEETFWEKQKRNFMEKISDAIKIKKADDIKENPSENIDKNSDDKSLYLKASELLKENKLKECVEILTKIKSEHEDIKIFIKNANERIKLNELFLKFKSEFISKNE